MNTNLSYSNAGTARNRNNNLVNLENLMKIMVQTFKKLLVFTALSAATMVAQAQVKVSTSDGEQIIATARSENKDVEARKNTIALFRTDNQNAASDSATEVCVIGMARGPENEFYEDVDFEVHGITEARTSVPIYILCGSISIGNMLPVGMVAILDAKLNLVSLRRYQEVKTFYDVYANDACHFVCGQLQMQLGSTALVLRDSIGAPEIAPNIMGFYTSNRPDWAFHKIAAKEGKNKETVFELEVQYEYIDIEQYRESRRNNEHKTNNTSPNPSKGGEQAPSLSERAGGEVQAKKIDFTVPTRIFEDKQSMEHEITLPDNTDSLPTLTIARIYISGSVLPPFTKMK
jgi:hypothetical protein